MGNNLREIQPYSNNSNDQLDYTKRYWFHHWITRLIALVENEKGELIEVNKRDFKFKTPPQAN